MIDSPWKPCGLSAIGCGSRFGNSSPNWSTVASFGKRRPKDHVGASPMRCLTAALTRPWGHAILRVVALSFQADGARNRRLARPQARVPAGGCPSFY